MFYEEHNVSNEILRITKVMSTSLIAAAKMKDECSELYDEDPIFNADKLEEFYEFHKAYFSVPFQDYKANGVWIGERTEANNLWDKFMVEKEEPEDYLNNEDYNNLHGLKEE